MFSTTISNKDVCWEDKKFYSMFENLDDSVEEYLRLRKAGELAPKRKGQESFYHAANSFFEVSGSPPRLRGWLTLGVGHNKTQHHKSDRAGGSEAWTG